MAPPLDQLLAILKNPALTVDLAHQPEVWKSIVRAADTHRLSGVLAHVTLGRLPDSERTWTSRVLMEHHAMHAQQLENLGRITDAFRSARLRFVSLKGPLLAERIHDQAFLKFSRDLDILVDEADIGRATRELHKLGYTLTAPCPWDIQRHINQHLVFAGPAGGRPLEVHYSLRALHFDLPAKEFLDHAVPWHSSAGFDACVLAPEHEAFYVAVHAAFHGFHRLRWLYDAIAAARHLDSAARNNIGALARKWRVSGYISAASMAAKEFFGESLDLGCEPTHALTAAQIRSMAQRTTDGLTRTLRQKILFRMDLCRMTESPADTILMCLDSAQLELRRSLFRLRSRNFTAESAAATLPGYEAR